MKNIIIKDFYYSIEKKELFKKMFFNFSSNNKYLLSGKNGCGKTTLIRNICKISCNNSISKKGVKISFFPKEMLLMQNLNGYELKKITLGNQDTQFLEEILGIDFLNSKIMNLSEGQTNKLLLLITLTPEVDFYIIDELINAIDYETKLNIIKYLNQLEKSFILITHDQELKNELQSKNTVNIKIENFQIMEF